MLVYDMQTLGLTVLDPDEKRLFYVAGDVWWAPRCPENTEAWRRA